MLDATVATEPAPGQQNNDYYLVAQDWAIVLDGVSKYPVPDIGCHHGVTWFVAHLGTHLAAALATGDRGESLPAALATAIRHTAQDHQHECDLTNPLTPAATVAIARHAGHQLDWLVLGDATIAWQLTNGHTDAATDNRLEELTDAPVVMADVRRYDPNYVAKVRNTPGGFWVAAANQDAADQALTGSLDTAHLTTVGLFTDGVTRLVDRYAWKWPDIFTTADKAGPRQLIHAVREAEQSDPEPGRWRGKPHDDATAVICLIQE